MPSLDASRRRFYFPLLSLALSAGMFLSVIETSSASDSTVQDEQTTPDPAAEKKAKKKQKAADKKKAESDESTNQRLDSIEKSMEALAKEVQALTRAMTAPPVDPNAEPKTGTEQGQKTKADETTPVGIKLDSNWLNEYAE